MSIQRFLLFLAATALVAQTPPAAPGVAAVKRALGLSDQQVQQLVQLRKDEQLALQPVRQQMQDKRQALETARQAATPNPTVVGQLVLDLQTLQKKVQASNLDYHNRALALLDAAQEEKLKELGQSAGTQRPAIRGAVMLNLLLPPAGMRGGRGMGPRAGV